MKAVKLTKLVQEMNLKNLTPEVDMEHVRITLPDINRPALQLTGYFEHFASERVQIIGYVEYTYLMHLNPEERKRSFENFVSKQIPCVIFTTMTEPDEDMLDMGRKYNVPILVTEKTTSNFMAEIIRWLNVQLAPCISIHGVLVDVYGEGVLIMGESGIGKSEAALELIKRGHRLVSDDVVEISKVSDVELVGTAPDITRHFIELRGIGIIDVKTLFGVESVKNTQSIDLVIKLEEFETMKASNDKINCWYKDFPYANPDDPGAKGIVFSHGQGAPYDNADFRWGICLALNIDEISMNTFSGAGRAAPIPLMNNTQFLQETYTIPMQDWLENFELDLGDGTTFKPYDTGYAKRMADSLGIEGTDEELITMFGAGWWKHDEEAATKLLEKAGLEKVNGVWNYEGKPFTFEMSYLADTEFQEARGVQAAYNQLTKFGFQCSIASKSSATWDVDGGKGNYQIAGYWPSGGILKDFYSAISGFDGDLIKPLGETGSGQGLRWNNEKVTEILHELANTDPESDRSYELHTEFLKECVTDMPEINFLSGTKFVPTNSTYWEGYPDADNPYNGPWWWWSCFKYMLPNITPTQA